MGIAHATADTWLSDEPPEMYRSACLALAGRLKAAQDASEKMLLGRILRASEDPRHWTAGAWILERSRGYIVRQDRGEGPQVVVNIGVLHVGERRDTPVSQIIDAEAIPASLPSPHRGDSE
jgi:hypothetical protein